MIKTHKRKKSSRIRGSKTAGWGFRQKHKGHGNKGGVGMAGSGKKADHKKQVAVEMDKNKKYFGRAGLTSRGAEIKKYEKINLRDIKANFLVKGSNTINLEKHKILGEGDGFKAEITAKSATKSAIEKMEKAGGKIILLEKKFNKKKEEAPKKSKDKEAPKKSEDKKESISEKKTVKKKVVKK